METRVEGFRSAPHVQVAQFGPDVVGAHGHVARKLPLEAGARLPRIRQVPVRIVELDGARVLRQGARGNIEFSSALFTTGPLTRNGFVGSRPADGPGSTLFVDGQMGAVTGRKLAVNESETRPPKPRRSRT